ncbi:MarR family winged helix-turn-helix transcriptional regulator [Microbacterium fluvii]|uniref:MarR family winged helix-turn-helix transcriptional regulator n=1 Tax=Microbacterium fluvii TaxID=415215 RepID=A0ABW2HDW3_9MICO|nr:MarR family transcriptional regulator [Microbacterium fluvii]MCU4672667.1 MarR family transcriptional regulator [Microbacterium fluvii]
MSEAARETTMLAALTRLISRWSTASTQRAIAEGVGVTLDAADIRAVYVLGLHGGAARPSELADELSLTRPTMSKLLARLAAAGLIDREGDPTDGRASRVALSDEGAAVFERLFGAGVQLVREALADWPAADAAAIATLLPRFVDAVVGETRLVPAEPDTRTAVEEAASE